jgi:cell division protein FtsL
MSSFLAPTRTRVRIADAVTNRARLSVVRGTTNAPRVPFAALVLTVLGLGLVVLLVLNTSLQQGAFQARDMEDRAQVLTEQREALELQVAELREPQRVADRAAAMGMVPNDSPAFLRLTDGKVLGNSAPALAAAPADFLTPPRAEHDSPVRTGSNGEASAAEGTGGASASGAGNGGSGR